MSDEDTDEPADAEDDVVNQDEEAEDITPDSLRERLDGIRQRLEAADSEADLDEVETAIEHLESDIEAADLPEPDDEDETGPAEEIATDVEDVRSDLEEHRGPYAEDVGDVLSDVASTIEDTRWTDNGAATLADAVGAFVESAGATLPAAHIGEGDRGTHPETVTAVKEAIEGSDLDPDQDAEVIADLLDAAETLAAAVDDAEQWDDLTIREILDEEGFYDVLDHRKDFPPEWQAIKIYERDNEPEPILRALELFDSEFMEKHCLDALKRLGAAAALDDMLQRAERRDQPAIEVLGKIADDEPVEMLAEYAATDSNPQLQKVSLRALGEIGNEEATQAVADRLATENDEVRSQAARALGLIGDTRAVEPLTTVLAEDDADNVRASAAWALTQIGTEHALSAVREYTDDPAYIVQAEAEKVQ